MTNKTRLFNVFSENRAATFKKFGISINEQDQESEEALYLCPLSLLLFPIESTKQGYLSVEHVPPASLGGMPLVLTSTALNNKDGHTSDIKLLKFFQGRNFDTNSGEIDVKISSEHLDFQRITAKFSLSATEKQIIKLVSSKENIKALDYKGLFKNWDGTKFNLTWQIQKEIDKKAILKCAYLTAFRLIGYELLFDVKGFRKNTYGQLIKYLENPEERFPVIYRAGHAPLEQSLLGVVNSPIQFSSIFVNLTFILKGNTFKYIVFLPHPNDTSLDNFHNLNSAVGTDGRNVIDFKISEIKPLLSFD